MLTLHTLPLGAYQTNCYILHQEESSSCVVIDPGYTPEVVLSFLEGQGLTLEAILLTHGHFDHVGGVRDLAAETGCKVYLNPNDLSMPPRLTAGPLYYTDTYSEGDTITPAGISFQVLSTPGHTPGSVCLIAENFLFSGDTLFAGSCGRTDLPGGSTSAIRASLRRLAALPQDYSVHPGHGESTTLAWEKQYNPYMR
ncbi:MAG: MBL fold metallo-hydrolase [Candidatus Faecousia sp.]|nr:MBL fold metallo-hydrolase [Clostridiales bacterium]MDY6181765.1 MBL fold metallo-hydrolase [Candidatus Faecousia sp.]